MSDDAGLPRPVDEDVDPAALAAVARALDQASHLRPDDPGTPAEPMPDWAWERITAALAAEAAPPRRPSRVVQWAGGLVAASVAVLAVGIGVTTFSGSDGPVVAGDSPTVAQGGSARSAPGPAASLATSGTMAEAMPAPAPTAAEAVPLVASPGPLAAAGMISPTLRLVDSDTDYTRDELTSQVTEVLEENGLEPTADAVAEAMVDPAPALAMSTVPANGFTRTLAELRDCITRLTREVDSTALLVDRSTFEGKEAGVVVAPPDERPMSRLQVLVVDPECDVIMSVSVALQR